MKHNKIRKISAFTASCIAVSMMLSGCGDSGTITPEPAETLADTAAAAVTEAAETESEAAAEETAAESDNENVMYIGKDSAAEDVTILNFVPPEKGEEIAVITVKDFGVIKIKLFPDAAPEAVENFKGLINMNYYDELIFHRVIPNFMDQGGDPKGNGTGGKSIWGDKFDGGIAEGLYHFTGAVAYANSGSTSTDGSQFYIVNTPDGYMQNSCEELMAYDPTSYYWPQNVVDMYNEKGGTPFLDGGYTVFGQVIEGMDVVRAIAEVETDENDKPLKQVMMETVRLEEYSGE